jgi:hypothetical protein
MRMCPHPCVDAHHTVEASHRGVRDRLPEQGSGVVDEDVDAAEAIERGPDGRRHRVLVAHVYLDRKRTTPQRFDLCGRGVDRPREPGVRLHRLRRDHDVGALPRQGQRDAPPDAARRARDERHLAVEPHDASIHGASALQNAQQTHRIAGTVL